MGLMLSVLVMCVGVLEAISSAQHIRESFLPLEAAIRQKRRTVVDHGSGNVRHADISWPGDIPRGSHVIKKRSGLTSPHSSFEVPEDNPVRRCSEHFDSVQLERAVSAILLEEDNSSDETSEEVTQILSGVVQSRIEFPTQQTGSPKKLPLPETTSHDTFAPINEPRHEAERVPGKQPLLASEPVEADIVDLKLTERLIKYPSAETVLDDDSSESSEKYSREKRSASKSETSVSYGSELPSSSLSSEISVDEGCKPRSLDFSSVSKNEGTAIIEKEEIAKTGNGPHKIEVISDITEAINETPALENTVDISPQQQLLSMQKTSQLIDQNTNHQYFSETQVPALRNDDEPNLNESEPFSQQETIVELIESTNSIVFSEDVRPTLRHSDSIVELIHSTNNLVFVPEGVSQSQQHEIGCVSVDRQESIEKLIESTNNVLFQEPDEHQDSILTKEENDSDDEHVQSSNIEDNLSNVVSREGDTSLTEQVSTEPESLNARVLKLVEVDNDKKPFINESCVETQGIYETGILEIDSDIPIKVLGAPVSEKADSLPSSAESNGEEYRSMTCPIQSSGSSEEEDSANSVTTVITECEQAIVDIGPPLENKNDSSSYPGDTDEILPSPRLQGHGTTHAIPTEFDYVESIGSNKKEDSGKEMDTVKFKNESKNSDSILTDEAFSDCHLSKTPSNIVEQNSVIDANDNTTSSPEPNVEPIIVVRKRHSTDVDKVITETAIHFEKQPQVRNDDSEIDSGSTASNTTDELIQNCLVINQESENILKKQADEVVASAVTTHSEVDKETSESIQIATSPTECLGKVEKNVFSGSASMEEIHTFSHDDVPEKGMPTISDFTTPVPDKQTSLVLNSDKQVEKLTQKLDVEESSSVFDKYSSGTPGIEILDQTEILIKEIQIEDSSSSSPDLRTISKTQTHELSDSGKVGITATEGNEPMQKDSATQIMSEEPLSFVDTNITSFNSPESEEQKSGDVSAVVPSSAIDLHSIKTENHQLNCTSKGASDPTVNIMPELTKTEYPTAVVDNITSLGTSSEQKGTEETLVGCEQIVSRDTDASKIETVISKTFGEQLVDKPTEGATETGNSILTSRASEIAEKITEVKKEIQSRDDDAEALANSQQVASVVVDNGRPAITSDVIEKAGKSQVTGNIQLEDSQTSNTSPHQQLDRPAQNAAGTEKLTSSSVEEEDSPVIVPASKESGKPENDTSKISPRNSDTSKMGSQITETSHQHIDSKIQNTDIKEKIEAKTFRKRDGRPTNEIATDLTTSASEVRQEMRRMSSLDEDEVINVQASQNRTADMENVQDIPSSSPNKAFWLIFSGEYTKAMSKDWHSGHFCCWQCDESLTGQRYVLRDDHPYCIKCYESVFANTCDECNKTIGIDSKDLSYKDKHWHEACFFCNKCRVSLVDKQFGSKADKIYCGNCYDAQFASRCDGCGQIFRAGTKKMEYKTRQWHEQCFCCCVCKSAIGTKSFIPREQEIYCATCYEEKFATRCVKCNKIITSGGVTYKNEPWHRECFTCTNCNTSLAGQRFTSRDEKPYCADCFGELFAKRCTSCCKPITGIGGTRFISFEDRHWHNDCFICASCKTSLVGRGFITDAEDILCTECAKQKLM